MCIRRAWADAYNDVHCSGGAANGRQDHSVRPSSGRFDVGGRRLVTPPIRGRAGELKAIGALVTALVQGRGGVLVIEGPPGIGKSRLLTEVLALADKCGVRALFGEAFEYQQTVPFFALFMATLGADPPVGDADALRRLGGSADLRYWGGRQLRRLGVERRIVSQPRAKTGWDSLTDSELKVVNLIAQGATNRSVAQELHVTPHTVKAHLHNAFAKLGINSRAELSKLMHGTDDPAK